MRFRSLLSCAAILISSHLFADYWKYSSGYKGAIINTPLAEGSLYTTNPVNGSSYKIYYSFTGNPQSQSYGGKIRFLAHIVWQGKKTLFPIRITAFQNQKQVLDETLETVNFPVSIRNPSSYFVEFTYQQHKSYTFTISSPEKKFLPVKIAFHYPPKRF